MKTTVTLHAFQSAFKSLRPHSFSYEGLEVLFNYFEDCELGTGEEVELDVIGICCEYTEDTTVSIANAYNIDIVGLDDDEAAQEVQEFLEIHTTLVGEVAGGFVYVSF